jgi:transposase-like protein
MSELAKRRYRKLSPEEWAEVRALWSSGGIDLATLSERYGVNSRTIQAHCAKHGVSRGSASVARARAAEERIIASALPDSEDELVAKVRFAKAAALQDADTIRSMVMAQFQAIGGPSEGLSAVAALRAIDIGAATLERARRSRFAALGLDKGDPLAVIELPELPIRVMTEEEVAAIRDRHQREEEESGVLYAEPGDDDVVIEGPDNDEEMIDKARVEKAKS